MTWCLVKNRDNFTFAFNNAEAIVINSFHTTDEISRFLGLELFCVFVEG
jgi:hypothetical protein